MDLVDFLQIVQTFSVLTLISGWQQKSFLLQKCLFFRSPGIIFCQHWTLELKFTVSSLKPHWPFDSFPKVVIYNETMICQSIYCSDGSGSKFMVWVWIWKISPKNVKFFNFFPLRSKKISAGWVKKYLVQRQVGLLFTAGQK